MSEEEFERYVENVLAGLDRRRAEIFKLADSTVIGPDVLRVLDRADVLERKLRAALAERTASGGSDE